MARIVAVVMVIGGGGGHYWKCDYGGSETDDVHCGGDGVGAGYCAVGECGDE